MKDAATTCGKKNPQHTIMLGTANAVIRFVSIHHTGEDAPGGGGGVPLGLEPPLVLRRPPASSLMVTMPLLCRLGLSGAEVA